METQNFPYLVVGLGNPILSDDGVGIRVAQAVRERLGETEVEFLEASLGGLRLAEQLEGYDRVILVDAIQTRGQGSASGGGTPGTIYRLTLDDFPSYNADGAHDASLKTALQLIRQQGGKTPDAVAVVAYGALVRPIHETLWFTIPFCLYIFGGGYRPAVVQ